MKYLIAGLGNPGAEYENTRHNIGFMVADAMGGAASFATSELALTTEIVHEGRTLFLIKPTTFMNLSGRAVRRHLQLHGLAPENLLVITDDISLPFGDVRVGGSDGGHNGLKSVTEELGTNAYTRLRVGVGRNFARGMQADYVLSPFTAEEQEGLGRVIARCAEAALRLWSC